MVISHWFISYYTDISPPTKTTVKPTKLMIRERSVLTHFYILYNYLLTTTDKVQNPVHNCDIPYAAVNLHQPS